MSQEEQPKKKQRLIQVVVEDDDTKQTLMKKLDDAAKMEIRLKNTKACFVNNIAPHKESFERLKKEEVDTLISYLLYCRPYLKLTDKARSSRRGIDVELGKYQEETQEYILETTDVYYPLQFFEGKKACLRELLKEVAERVEKLEEKDL
jgi:hypothetical protein